MDINTTEKLITVLYSPGAFAESIRPSFQCDRLLERLHTIIFLPHFCIGIREVIITPGKTCCYRDEPCGEAGDQSEKSFRRSLFLPVL